MRSYAEQGRWTRGPAFGWGRVPVEANPGRIVQRFTGKVHPVEGPMIVAATAAVIAGDSLRSIARAWNNAGVPTPNGMRWTPTGVRQIVMRASNAGLVVHRGDVLEGVVGQWERIVDPDLWRAACLVLTDPARATTQPRSDTWVGAGVYKCGTCGGLMRSARASIRGGGTRATYRCRSERHVYRGAEPIDEYVTAVVLAYLARPEHALPAPTGTVEDAELRGERERLLARLDEVADDYADDRITAGQRDRISARTRKRIADIDGRLSAGSARAVVAGVTPEVWGGLSVERRRRIIAAVVDVVILPIGHRTARFDPATVRLDWLADR